MGILTSLFKKNDSEKKYRSLLIVLAFLTIRLSGAYAKAKKAEDKDTASLFARFRILKMLTSMLRVDYLWYFGTGDMREVSELFDQMTQEEALPPGIKNLGRINPKFIGMPGRREKQLKLEEKGFPVD